MNVAPIIQKIITLFRFELFQHIPEDEKLPYIKQLIQFPFDNHRVCEITEKVFVTNQLWQIRKLIHDTKKAKLLLQRHRYKDYDFILQLYMAEKSPDLSGKLLYTLLNFSIINEDCKKKWDMTMNLLFSASCEQDKIAALYFLNAE